MNPKAIYRYVKQNEPVRDYTRAILNSSNEVTTDRIEIANVLNTKFKSVFVKETNFQMPSFPRQTDSVLSSCAITIEDVREKLAKLDGSKAMGPDEVHPRILKESANSLALPMMLIFRESVNTATVPQAWKDAYITPLFKKGSKLDPGNYRPVSLTYSM